MPEHWLAMKKHTLFFILVGLVAFSRMAFADTQTVNGITWTYTVSNGEASVGGGKSVSPAVATSTTGSITIPSTLAGYPVTSIGDYAFSDCSGLTLITIPDGVTSIGDYAFSGCSGLTSITIPDGVTSIGSAAFSGCSGLASVTIPDSVTSIGSAAFSGCSGLASVTIPDSVTSIGSYAFSGCSGLTSITIPDGVTSIGQGAFQNCSSLVSITIPDSVTSIYSFAFSGCPDELFDTNCIPGVRLVDGWVVGTNSMPILSGSLDLTGARGLASSAFRGCSGLTSITIPDGVASIGHSAFEGCTRLASITIPDSVTSIDSWTFYGCSGLTTITIPDGVTSIGYMAFSDCSGLTSITIPDSVTSIGDYAFQNCSGLTSIAIGDGVESVGNYAFSGCSGATSITIGAGVESIGNYAFSDCSGLESITIPDSVTSIGYRALSGCFGLIEVTLPFVGSQRGNSGSSDALFGYVLGSASSEGATRIRQYGFVAQIGSEVTVDTYLPMSLRRVTITDESTLDYGAFSGCYMLTSITIPDSVTNIGAQAFYNCRGLTSITIPDGVTSIGDCAFEGCSGLTAPIYHKSGTLLLKVPVSEQGVFQVPETVTRIGPYAFTGCSELTSISIPDSVTNIEDCAFSGCSKLTSITIPDGVTTISYNMFSSCSRLHSIVIPDSVTMIESAAFSDCSTLTSLTIPVGVTNIGSYAFSGCRLKTLRLPQRFKNYGYTIEGCSIIFSKTIVLTVESEYGETTPHIGQTSFELYDPIDVTCSLSVTNMHISNGVRASYIGWTGTGDIPVGGTEANETFAIGRNSSITWNWRKENRITVSVTGDGTCTFGTQWVADGATATAEIVPSTHLFAVALSGDTNGVTIAGTTLSIPSDGPRDIIVTIEELNASLDIVTEHGTPTPAGRTEWSWGDEVSASVIADEPENGVRFVCTGWTGTGSAPLSGTGTNVIFTITEDSTLTWNWQKQNSIKVSIVDGATCSFGEKWIEDGATATATINPAWHLYTITMSGDTNGVVVSGKTLRIPSDGPRDIVVSVKEKKVRLVVSSGYGMPTPRGVTTWSWGDQVTASIQEPSPVNGRRYVCTGWQGYDGLAGSWGATAAPFSFLITEDSWIVWNWKEFFLIDCTIIGGIAPTNIQEWVDPGSTRQISFDVGNCGQFFCWAIDGDGDGVSVNAYARTITIPADSPRTLLVRLVTADTAVGTEGKPLVWGAYGTDWRPVFDESASDGMCLRSGEIGAGGRSTLTATVSGEGTLSFNWKISAGRGDFCRFYVDGFETNSIQRSTGWKTTEVRLGPGTHELKWIYERGSGDATGEDAAFLDDIDWRTDVKLSVSSAYGTPDPAHGTHTLRYGDDVLAVVDTPDPADGVRRVCTGWTGTGSVPARGTETATSFTIKADSSIVWNWRTDYRVALAAEGPVAADFAEDWLAAGSTQTVHWTTTAPYFAAEVSGDTNGVILDTEARTLAIPADGPRAVTLSVRRLTLADALDSPDGLRWTTSGPSLWFPQIGTSDDGEDAAQSGTVTNGNDTCVLATAVDGPGAFSWTWRLDSAAGGNAGVDVWLDGEWLGDYAPGAEWSRETLDVSGDGTHKIRFEFWNAGTAATHGDHAFLDRVFWTGAAIPSGTVTVGGTDVPVSWLDENATDFITAAGGDAVRAAEAQAANGENAVWECYVAGIDPTSTTNHFLAQIVVTNGSAAVTWTPDLNEGGTKAERIYTVEGKEALSDPGWGPTNAASRFFRVKVEMP